MDNVETTRTPSETRARCQSRVGDNLAATATATREFAIPGLSRPHHSGVCRWSAQRCRSRLAADNGLHGGNIAESIHGKSLPRDGRSLVRQNKNHLKLVLDLLLFIIEFRDAPQPDLWSFDDRRYDMGAVDIRELLRLLRRHTQFRTPC